MTIEQITNHLHNAVSYIPFVGMIAQKQSPISTRLVEAAIIAIVTGYISAQVTLAGLEKDITWIKDYSKETRIELNKLRDAYYAEKLK